MLDTATVETLEERITEMVTENITTAQEEVEEKVKEDSVEDPTYEIYKPVLDAYYDVLIGEKTSTTRFVRSCASRWVFCCN